MAKPNGGTCPHYPVLHAPSARAPPMTRFLLRRLLNYIVLLALAWLFMPQLVALLAPGSLAPRREGG